MFLAPGLYVVHAALTAVSVAVAAMLHTTAGFSFSAGLVDYVLSFNMPLANNPWMLLIMGVVFFVIYYVLFRILIVKFNLKTPGREDDDDEVAKKEAGLTLKNTNFAYFINTNTKISKQMISLNISFRCLFSGDK